VVFSDRILTWGDAIWRITTAGHARLASSWSGERRCAWSPKMNAAVGRLREAAKGTDPAKALTSLQNKSRDDGHH